uniref:HMG box domain-containing protein n=1 Tax=Globisporangium ultimum (strain ATCC 200006 / CBS 805.95 / DAOM BR144) TaxID=431595 RepID=K3WUV2_GLOUD
MPRPINPFIVYCQVQKDFFNRARPKRSAGETRKIMGDMWRNMTDEEKEYYAQLTEVENEKRRREHIFDLRDRAIAEWEEEEARRKGVLGSSVLDTTSEHTRGLLLANYMNERHEVDQHREDSKATLDDADDEEE